LLDEVYVYDAVPSGADLTELMVRMQGGAYRHFDTALDVVIGSLVKEWECADGCPHCLYQYGCHNWNQPATLSRHSMWMFLTGGLRLRLSEDERQDVDIVVAPAPELPVELPCPCRRPGRRRKK